MNIYVNDLRHIAAHQEVDAVPAPDKWPRSRLFSIDGLAGRVANDLHATAGRDRPLEIRCNRISTKYQGEERFGGARRNRTADLLNAIQALSQLSYGPTEVVARRTLTRAPRRRRKLGKAGSECKRSITPGKPMRECRSGHAVQRLFSAFARPYTESQPISRTGTKPANIQNPTVPISAASIPSAKPERLANSPANAAPRP